MATDFSPTGREAVRVAMDFARRTGATLHIVHVKAPLNPTLPLSRDNRELVKDLQREQSAEARLRLHQLVPKTGPLKVRTRLLHGKVPSFTILAHAERVEADLLVLGRRGQSALADLLIGSTADRVARQASTLVLLIPPHSR